MQDVARVLVVEDEPSLLKAIGLMLSASGHEPILVADGESAVERLDQDGVDLVLTDMMMPGMDGFELLRHVNARTAAPPVIMMSGSDLALSGPDYLSMARALGACCTVRKPVRRAELADAIDRCLNEAAGRRADSDRV